MDWSALLVGGIVGAICGVVIDKMMFAPAVNAFRIRRRRRRHAEGNRAWRALEQTDDRLVLVQAGWDIHGCFPEGSVVLRLGEAFEFRDGQPREFLEGILEKNRAGWLAAGFTDGEQVGIANISRRRISDDHAAELHGSSHQLRIDVHTYKYFQFLATHVLRLQGDHEVKRALNAMAGAPTTDGPVSGFPTPLSVGLSLFCESGDFLMLTRRSADTGSGGFWEPGKIFNPVGENAAMRDFVALGGHARETNPEVIARRGLYEEMGLVVETGETDVRLHSFAWAADLLDFKFFGYAQTALARDELQDRWMNAPDRSEGSGVSLIEVPIRTKAQCLELLLRMRDEPESWSPEATFSTVRSLLALGRISGSDVARARRSG